MAQAGTGSVDLSVPRPWSVAANAPLADLRQAAAVEWDVVVVGCGNAALVAALAASRAARRVLVLERAPRHMRGGNTRHTRNIRCAHDEGDDFTPGRYSVEELMNDLQGVGKGPLNPVLARLAALESQTIPAWMEHHGVRWQHSLAGTLSLSRTNRFFLGGGTALVNHYARVAETKKIRLLFDAGVSDFLVSEDRRVRGVVLETGGGLLTVRCRAVVVASGGFEANLSWLRQYWHEAADGFVVRGTPYNDGAVLARLVDHGAEIVGDPYGFHAIAVDARAPRFDGGIATRVDAVPFSIVVNRRGHRFGDEGADIWPKRYASWGGLIAAQEDQIAFAVYDSRAAKLFMPTMYPPYVGATVAEVAGAAGLGADQVTNAVQLFNTHAGSVELFDADRLDGCATHDLAPPKSHWALPIQIPPYYIVPLRPGITFTFRGVAVNERAQVLGAGGQPFVNLYAAGEVMSGNILSTGYLAGFGLTIGTVFGRIAGTEASLQSAR